MSHVARTILYVEYTIIEYYWRIRRIGILFLIWISGEIYYK